jgi:hypothetical protein
MAPVSNDFLKKISILSLPTLKNYFVKIFDYEKHALLPGLRNCLPSPHVFLKQRGLVGTGVVLTYGKGADLVSVF